MAKKVRRQQAQEAFDHPTASQTPRERRAPHFQPITERQQDMVDAIAASTVVFAIGPAGTGKSFVAANVAASYLLADNRRRVLVTRPAVEAAGEKLGFLPGELEEKFDPYVRPVLKILEQRLGKGAVESMVKNGRITFMPLAFMRGETFDDCFVIADEAQNMTKEQMKMLLTRIGRGSVMVVDGDPMQSDIGSKSGLEDAVYRLRDVSGVSVVRFGRSDIVRHDIIQEILDAYETPGS